MDSFKQEVWAELKDQRETSEAAIHSYHKAHYDCQHEIHRKKYEEAKLQHMKMQEEENKKYQDQHQKYIEH